MADVFVSYRRSERHEVDRIVSSLRDLGLSVWFDASLSAGDAFSDEIDREARSAKVILVCWSPTARDSRWVKAEAMIGFEHDKLAACYVAGPDGFSPPTPFNASHAADLRSWLAAPSGDHAGWTSLLRAIGRLCDRPDLQEAVAGKTSSFRPASSEARRLEARREVSASPPRRDETQRSDPAVILALAAKGLVAGALALPVGLLASVMITEPAFRAGVAAENASSNEATEFQPFGAVDILPYLSWIDWTLPFLVGLAGMLAFGFGGSATRSAIVLASLISTPALHVADTFAAIADTQSTYWVLFVLNGTPAYFAIVAHAFVLVLCAMFARALPVVRRLAPPPPIVLPVTAASVRDTAILGLLAGTLASVLSVGVLGGFDHQWTTSPSVDGLGSYSALAPAYKTFPFVLGLLGMLAFRHSGPAWRWTIAVAGLLAPTLVEVGRVARFTAEFGISLPAVAPSGLAILFLAASAGVVLVACAFARGSFQS